MKEQLSPSLSENLNRFHSVFQEDTTIKFRQMVCGLTKRPVALIFADGMVSDTKRNSFVRDAGLILAAQKVEHYEIATYGTLCALAEYLPEKKIKRLIERTLAEEKKADQLLTKLAEDFVNEYAAVE